MVSAFVVRVALGIYAVLLAAGGMIGYRKAQSKPSLIAGLASGGLGILAAVLVGFSPVGAYLGLALAIAMAAFFGKRFAKGRKFMPAGLLAILSVVVLVLILLHLFA